MILERLTSFITGRPYRPHGLMRPIDAIRELSLSGMILGYDDAGKPVTIPWGKWTRHSLILGIPGSGKERLREWLFFQQIMLGGGLMWPDWGGGDYGMKLLQDMCHLANREADFMVLDLKAGDRVDPGMITGNKVIYVKLPLLEKHGVAAWLARDLTLNFRDVVTEMLKVPRESRPKISFLNYMDEFGVYAKHEDSTLFEQAKGANIVMVPVVHSMANLDNLGPEMKEVVLGNTWNKVFFRAASRESAWPGRGYFDDSVTESEFVEARMNLDIGEALVAGPQEKPRRIQVTALKFE